MLGIDAFHGSVFYYNRNFVFRPNDALDEADGNPTPNPHIPIAALWHNFTDRFHPLMIPCLSGGFM